MGINLKSVISNSVHSTRLALLFPYCSISVVARGRVLR